MLYKIDDNVWFDNESIEVLKKGEMDDKVCVTCPSKKHVPSVKDSTWRPNIIYLAATTCNLKCKYCYADEGTYGITDEKKQFSTEDYIKSFDKIWGLYDGVKAISFFGGEPLLNFKEIKKFVEYIYEKYDHEKIPTMAINTNGTLLNEDILDFLEQYNFIVGTSVDGTREIHDKNRVSDNISSTYELVTKNLRRIAEKNLKIYVQYTFTKQHLDKYTSGKAKEWCEEMEKLTISTYEVIPVSTNNPQYMINLQSEETFKRYTQFCEEIANYYLEKLLNGDINKIPRMFIGLMIRVLMQVEQHDCSAGYSVSITPNGQIYPCHTFTEFSEYGVNIDDVDNTLDISENEKFQSVRNACRESSSHCNDCISRKICGIWCKGLQNSVKGDMKSPLYERCELMKIYTRAIIKFIATEYHKNKKIINSKLINYNKIHK